MGMPRPDLKICPVQLENSALEAVFDVYPDACFQYRSGPIIESGDHQIVNRFAAPNFRISA
jgi:hypothetical protein